MAAVVSRGCLDPIVTSVRGSRVRLRVELCGVLKWLVTLALTVIVFGLLLPPQRTRLPGDVTVNWRGRRFVFPFASALLFSLVAYVIMRVI